MIQTNKMPKKKIIVVDDDPGILEVLHITLENEGYEVTPISNAGKLFSAIKTVKPHAILLDVLLSGFDGREIAKKLKSQKETKDIPLIMLSAHPSADRTTIAAGADDFLPKPFDIDELLTMVKKHMGK